MMEETKIGTELGIELEFPLSPCFFLQCTDQPEGTKYDTDKGTQEKNAENTQRITFLWLEVKHEEKEVDELDGPIDVLQLFECTMQGLPEGHNHTHIRYV